MVRIKSNFVIDDESRHGVLLMIMHRVNRHLLLIVHIVVISTIVSSCGGDGLFPNMPAMVMQGDIDGYVYAAVGSQHTNRVAESPPPGQMGVEGANVSATSGGITKTAVTNEEGYFNVAGLPVGDCVVMINKSGYSTTRIELEVSANSTTRVGGSIGTKLMPSNGGAIRVTTNVAGIEVFIDNIGTGIVITSSLTHTFTDISTGDHEVSVDWTGYAPAPPQIVAVAENDIVDVGFSLLPPDVVPPVANAGEDGKTYVITRYEYVYNHADIRDYMPYENYYTLDGSGSYDAGGGEITYEWTQTSGMPIILASATDSKPTFVPTQEDTYVFTLVVRDAAGNVSVPDTVSVVAKKPIGKIAYTGSTDQRDRDVMIISFDGFGIMQATENNYYDMWPHWSPDGGKILYATNPSDDELTFYVATMNADGTGINVTDTMGRTRDWSPDGSQILYEWSYQGTDQLYQSAPDATDKSLLTTTPRDKFFAAYSPDGTKIMFTVHVSYDGIEIVVMNRDGSDYRQLTNENKTHGYISWTPDGRILYTTADCIGCKSTLHVMNADGTGRQAWPMPEGLDDIAEPVMTNDGRFIFFTYKDKIHVMHVDGSVPLNLGVGGYNIDYHPGP